MLTSPTTSTNPTSATHAPRGRRHLLEGGQVVRHEGRLEQKVLGGIAGDGELGEGDDVGTLRLDPRQAANDPLGVAVDLAHDGVELAQGDTQALHSCSVGEHRAQRDRRRAGMLSRLPGAALLRHRRIAWAWCDTGRGCDHNRP